MLEKYRKTMTGEVLHSWAEDAQEKIDHLSAIVQKLRDTHETFYNMSPEGRNALAEIDKALNS